jgi:hypothetical protein
MPCVWFVEEKVDVVVLDGLVVFLDRDFVNCRNKVLGVVGERSLLEGDMLNEVSLSLEMLRLCKIRSRAKKKSFVND